jgi:hypothetical protein
LWDSNLMLSCQMVFELCFIDHYNTSSSEINGFIRWKKRKKEEKKSKWMCGEIFKVRLFAKGFDQRWEVDYTETFSFMFKTSTIQIILAMAVQID